MKKGTSFLLIAGCAILLAVVGCGKEEEYKVEGPKATDNPSVGTPVGSGTTPGGVIDGAPAPGSKGAPPTPGSRPR
jgi:hypothetical protein